MGHVRKLHRVPLPFHWQLAHAPRVVVEATSVIATTQCFQGPFSLMHCVQEGRRSKPVAWMRAARTWVGRRKESALSVLRNTSSRLMGDRAKAGTALCERTLFSRPRRSKRSRPALGIGKGISKAANRNRATGKGPGQHVLAQRDGTEPEGTDMVAP